MDLCEFSKYTNTVSDSPGSHRNETKNLILVKLSTSPCAVYLYRYIYFTISYLLYNGLHRSREMMRRGYCEIKYKTRTA